MLTAYQLGWLVWFILFGLMLYLVVKADDQPPGMRIYFDGMAWALGGLLFVGLFVIRGCL